MVELEGALPSPPEDSLTYSTPGLPRNAPAGGDKSSLPCLPLWNPSRFATIQPLQAAGRGGRVAFGPEDPLATPIRTQSADVGTQVAVALGGPCVGKRGRLLWAGP